jgi:diguanylate cyclase (GGDEF)-like protein
VILIDIDRFTGVNESLGQSAGDQVLATLASRLRMVVRPPDTVARFGSDEFVVVVGGITDADALRPLAHRLRGTLHQPVELPEGDVSVTTSIGVAAGTDSACTPDALIGRAGAAVARAKRRGFDKVELFDAHLDAALDERLSFESDLHQAARLGQLDLQFQPACDLTSGAVLGFEALVRWRHPVLGLLSPDRFTAGGGAGWR